MTSPVVATTGKDERIQDSTCNSDYYVAVQTYDQATDTIHDPHVAEKLKGIQVEALHQNLSPWSPAKIAYTDDSGRAHFQYARDCSDQPKWIVRLKTLVAGQFGADAVRNDGSLYTLNQDPGQDPGSGGTVWTSTLPQALSGAGYMLMRVHRAIDKARLAGYAPLHVVHIQWALNESVPGSGCGAASACYSQSLKTIYVGGNTVTPNGAPAPSEWDASIVLHEHGHNVMDEVSNPSVWVNNYGYHPLSGSHSWSSIHGSEGSAFGEAWADFYSSWALNVSRTTGQDLLYPNQTISLDEQPYDCVGAFRECSIASALWRARITVGFDNYLRAISRQPHDVYEFRNAFASLQLPNLLPPFDEALERFEIPSTGDAQSGHDAGNSTATAIHVDRDTWVPGGLSIDAHPGNPDTKDEYKFTVNNQGDPFIVYLQSKTPGAEFRITIWSPSFQYLGFGDSLGPGDIEGLYFEAPAAGEYLAEIEPLSESQGWYTFNVDPPEARLDRPFPVITAGQQTTICWHVTGDGPYDGTLLYYGMQGNGYDWTTPIQSAPGPGRYCASFYPPITVGTLIFAARVWVGNLDYWSTQGVAPINPVHGYITGIHYSQAPPDRVRAGEPFDVCYSLDGGTDYVRARLTWVLNNTSGGETQWHYYPPSPSQPNDAMGPTEYCEGYVLKAGYVDFRARSGAAENEADYPVHDTATQRTLARHNYLYAVRLNAPPSSLSYLPNQRIDVAWDVLGGGPVTSTAIEMQDLPTGVVRTTRPQMLAEADELGSRFTASLFLPATGSLRIAAEAIGPRNAEPKESAWYYYGVATVIPWAAASPAESSNEIAWAIPEFENVTVTGFDLNRSENGGTWTHLASLGPENRTFVDQHLSNGVSYAYTVAVITKDAPQPASEGSSSIPTPGMNAVATIFPVVGTQGSNQWYKSPVDLDLLASGPVESVYRGVEKIDIVRERSAVGINRYVDEFESTDTWILTQRDPLTNMQARVNSADFEQGQASVELQITNDPAASGDSMPFTSKVLPKALDATPFDRLEIYGKYASTPGLNSLQGRFDLSLMNGSREIFSSSNITLSQGGWSRKTVDVSGMTDRHITSVKLVLHEAHKNQFPETAEVQTFTFDALRVFASTVLRESSEGRWLWSTNVTDSAGVVQTTHHQLVKLDWTAPTTEFHQAVSAPHSVWSTNPVTVTLTATDSTSGVSQTQYRLDNGPVQNYNAPFVVSASGNHPLSYWSRDNAGNVETSRNVAIYVDSTAPHSTSTLSGTGDGQWFSTPVTFRFDATDANSGTDSLFFSVDDGGIISVPQREGQSSLSTGSLTVTAPGSHQLTWYAVDRAGNAEGLQTKMFTIEKIAPQVLSRAPAPGGSASSSVMIEATHDDDAGLPSSGIDATRTVFFLERSVAGPAGPWTDVTSQGDVTREVGRTKWVSHTIGGLAVGTYRVRGTIYDRAGNSCPIEGVAGWTFSVSPI